jgi:hypothetical protein
VMQRPRTFSSRYLGSKLIWLVTVVWLALGITGTVLLARYSYTPSNASEPAAHWPRGTPIRPAGNGFMLVMLVHPQCPCSAAGMEELARVTAAAQGHLETHVIFLRPEGFAQGWEQTALWRTASAIPGVRIWTDAGGREVERFGASVSGQVLLYDSSGELRLSGGITAGRGHAGDNPGLDAVREILVHGTRRPVRGPMFVRAPMFGCSLRSPRGTS